MVRPRKFEEEAVLDAAAGEFWATGYRGTSIDDIAAATGLGKGSLYGAFGGKHQLFLRVFDRYCNDVAAQASHALSGPDEDAADRLRSYVDRVAQDTASDVQHRGCLLAKGVAELSEHDPAVLARSSQTFTALEEALTDAVAAAQRHGDVDPAAEASDLALLLLAVLRGIEALGKAGQDPEQLARIAATALAVTTGAPGAPRGAERGSQSPAQGQPVDTASAGMVPPQA